MLTHSAVAAELRLFDLGSYFQSSYQTLRDDWLSDLRLIKSELVDWLLGFRSSGIWCCYELDGLAAGVARTGDIR